MRLQSAAAEHIGSVKGSLWDGARGKALPHREIKVLEADTERGVEREREIKMRESGR